MAYATVTMSNISYQAYENVKQIIEDNLTNYTKIYTSMPDITSISFKGFPIIVMPKEDFKPDFEYTGMRAISFENTIEGTIFHEFDKLGDNKLNILKQDLINIFFSKTNLKTLRPYGIDEVKFTIESQETEGLMYQNKQIIPIEFSIIFSLDLVTS